MRVSVIRGSNAVAYKAQHLLLVSLRQWGFSVLRIGKDVTMFDSSCSFINRKIFPCHYYGTPTWLHYMSY
jgi:hypothetical protein